MLKNENKNMLNFLELEFMLRNIHFNDWYDNQYSEESKFNQLLKKYKLYKPRTYIR